MTIWIVLGLAAALAAYAVLIYNRLVSTRQMTEEAWSGIDVQLKRRSDLIPNLVDTVKGYAAHERGVLEQVTRTPHGGAERAERRCGGARQGRRGALSRAWPASGCGGKLSGPEGKRELPRIAARAQRRWRTRFRWRAATTTAPRAT